MSVGGDERIQTRFLAANSIEWSNVEHGAQWRSTLTTYAAPVFGELPVHAIDTDLAIKALAPIWTTKTETASRLRGRIESVLDWATVSKLRSGGNPVRWRGTLEKLLPAPGKIAKVEHHPALAYRDVYAFLQLLAPLEATAARALEMVIYTGLRTTETLSATWAEIGLVAGVWTVPASQTTMKKEHRVPLSAPALQALRKSYATRINDYVFPSPNSTTGHPRPLSNMAKLEITEGSGNVFADLGFSPEESANLLFRCTLMARLTKIAIDRELTQVDAAKLFGVTQPRVNLLLRGKIASFSVDALVNMLARAGFTVEPRVVKTKAIHA